MLKYLVATRHLADAESQFYHAIIELNLDGVKGCEGDRPRVSVGFFFQFWSYFAVELPNEIVEIMIAERAAS